jgi:hypothetical protein
MNELVYFLILVAIFDILRWIVRTIIRELKYLRMKSTNWFYPVYRSRRNDPR